MFTYSPVNRIHRGNLHLRGVDVGRHCGVHRNRPLPVSALWQLETERQGVVAAWIVPGKTL